MQLRLDSLLAALRERPEEILRAIDRDPLLLKKESGGLVLANAGQELFTPRETHQLYAKGIVYRRQPYRLVSLPLIKIYNLGEHDVTVHDLAGLLAEPEVQVRFLRKVDGSLIQVFRTEERVWFCTRGMLEGARVRPQERPDEDSVFDYIETARRLAARSYPGLHADPAPLDGRTLVFELIHPEARKVTHYGDRSDLVLLAAFDQRRLAYLAYPDLVALAQAHGLSVVDALSPAGATLGEQIADMLASLAGTDQEGSVLTFERGGEIIYRVKVKSPDYLHLMRVLAECTYDRTVSLLDANPALTTWELFEAFLKGLGREQVPEEVIGCFRPHFERFRAYLEDCKRLQAWALRVQLELDAVVGGRAGKEASSYRKSFAAVAVRYPCSGLLFAALDGRLDLNRVRTTFGDPDEVRAALERVARS